MVTSATEIAPFQRGAARAYNPGIEDFGANEYMKYTAADAMKLKAEFIVDLEKTITADKRPAEWAEMQKGISPEISIFLQHANRGGASGINDTLKFIVDQLVAKNVLTADLVKDLGMTSPLSTGFVPYDLRAPSLKIFPALTPLRNRIPRTQGQGKAHQYKRITGISGSGTGGVADLRPTFAPEGASSSWGSLTLSRPTKIAYAADETTVTYRMYGLSDSVTFGGEWVGRGYESLRALSAFSLMKAVMLAEEKLLIGGRLTALIAPSGTPTGTARAATAGESAITGASTNVYLKATAVAQFGETVGSTASAAVAPTGGQVIDWTLPNDSIGALGYKLYVSTAAGADPGDGSRFFLAYTAWRKFTQQGAMPTTIAIPGADSGTNSTADFDGLHALADAGGYTGVNGRRFNSAPTATMFDSDLAAAWEGFKADPDEIFVGGTDRVNISNAIVNTASQSQAYRLVLTQGDAGSVVAGAVVGSFFNKVTSKEVKLTVHPWFKQGNALIVSWALPYPWSELPNTIEVRLVQDYLQIDWPVIQMSYDSSVIAMGALLLPAAAYFGSYHGIAQSDTGTFK